MYVAREKKRQLKNKKPRRSKKKDRAVKNSSVVVERQRAQNIGSNNSVTMLIHSPSVNPIALSAPSANDASIAYHRSQMRHHDNNSRKNIQLLPNIMMGGSMDGTNHNGNNIGTFSGGTFSSSAFTPPPRQSFFVEVDRQNTTGGNPVAAPTSMMATAPTVPSRSADADQQQQPPLPPQQVQQEGTVPNHNNNGSGGSLPLPIKNKNKIDPSQSQWMQDHDASLWNYVNGLVCKTSNAFTNKDELANEASSFSTDEILSEIATTFSPGGAGQEQEAGRQGKGFNGGGSHQQGVGGVNSNTGTNNNHNSGHQGSYNGSSYYAL
jgi:hypothetical protein